MALLWGLRSESQIDKLCIIEKLSNQHGPYVTQILCRQLSTFFFDGKGKSLCITGVTI